MQTVKDQNYPSSETPRHSHWDQSHPKPVAKDSGESKSDETSSTASPSIAHRISNPTGPTLLTRIIQENSESQSEPTTLS
ncbi:hypothetical protein PGT21_013605 [Puccinia graminis f. sp. tritici]|uniref:Uncharacterized protein n=1 Tax=Puccinia graminis f. sp. tritici TaxID=56615 RepID=A0A5B0PRT8_PUCGR|nr:hypothetical protein PGT21_013605 [Puccinia graminis f. sp. tritici]